MELVAFLILLAGLFMGWNIGANDASNAIGTTVGSGVLPFEKAVIIVIIFALLGATIDGHRVMKTVGKNIVPAIPCEKDSECLKDKYYCDIENNICRSRETGQKIIYLEKDRRSVLAALFAAGTFVVLITLEKLPVSTTQAIVGAVAGAGIGLNLFGGMDAEINYNVLKNIFLSWMLNPIVSILFAFLIYNLVISPLTKISGDFVKDRVIRILLILSAIFVSYNLGANDVANAVSPIVGANLLGDLVGNYTLVIPPGSTIALSFKLLPVFVAAFLGGLALGFGAVIMGRGVVETMGEGITQLGPHTAFAAQFASALTVYLFIRIGVPVSTTHAIVGGVIGVGLTKGIGTVNFKTVKRIVLGWFATPTVAGLLAVVYYYILRSVLKCCVV